MTAPTLSLLMPVRGRAAQLHCVLPLLAATPLVRSGAAEILVLESDAEPCHRAFVQGVGQGHGLGIRYAFDADAGVFHKTRLLNRLLGQAAGGLVVPYDVDLVPLGDALALHHALSAAHPGLLVCGYRVMAGPPGPDGTADLDPSALSVAGEDAPSALRKVLLDGERFGVLPQFRRARLAALGGWDEGYRGWGAEDQDLIERYLADGTRLVRAPDLVYAHLAHPPDALWAGPEQVEANRRRYYAKRAANRAAGRLAGIGR